MFNGGSCKLLERGHPRVANLDLGFLVDKLGCRAAYLLTKEFIDHRVGEPHISL